MKRLFYIAAAFAVLSCSGTQDNDPWGKLSDERVEASKEEEAKKGKVVELSMYSSKMKQNMTYSLWLPREYDETKEYPFLYLLHGYEMGDQSRLDRCWLDKGNAAKIAEKYQKEGGVAMIIVMPNGLSSFYQGDYEDYFETELMPKVENDYKCNGKRAIAGLSMGGYGTVYHALKYPTKFTYAYAMSPAINAAMAQGVTDISVLPGMTVETGDQDGLTPNAKAFVDAMKNKGFEIEYIHREGVHDWVFWQECLPKALAAVGATF